MNSNKNSTDLKKEKIKILTKPLFKHPNIVKRKNIISLIILIIFVGMAILIGKKYGGKKANIDNNQQKTIKKEFKNNEELKLEVKKEEIKKEIKEEIQEKTKQETKEEDKVNKDIKEKDEESEKKMILIELQNKIESWNLADTFFSYISRYFKLNTWNKLQKEKNPTNLKYESRNLAYEETKEKLEISTKKEYFSLEKTIENEDEVIITKISHSDYYDKKLIRKSYKNIQKVEYTSYDHNSKEEQIITEDLFVRSLKTEINNILEIIKEEIQILDKQIKEKIILKSKI